VALQSPFPNKIEPDCFADLACASWKLRQQVIDQKTGQPREDSQELARKVATLWDRLSALGLDIQDHTGRAFDPGEGIDVLAFEPTPNLSENTVIETIRPTVYLNGKKILTGLVVVGTPQPASAANIS
jgi:hypothetical protein